MPCYRAFLLLLTVGLLADIGKNDVNAPSGGDRRADDRRIHPQAAPADPLTVDDITELRKARATDAVINAMLGVSRVGRVARSSYGQPDNSYSNGTTAVEGYAYPAPSYSTMLPIRTIPIPTIRTRPTTGLLVLSVQQLQLLLSEVSVLLLIGTRTIRITPATPTPTIARTTITVRIPRPLIGTAITPIPRAAGIRLPPIRTSPIVRPSSTAGRTRPLPGCPLRRRASRLRPHGPRHRRPAAGQGNIDARPVEIHHFISGGRVPTGN